MVGEPWPWLPPTATVVPLARQLPPGCAPPPPPLVGLLSELPHAANNALIPNQKEKNPMTSFRNLRLMAEPPDRDRDIVPDVFESHPTEACSKSALHRF